MAVRTRMSPGVEWKEIDKSGYTPTIAGSTVYLKGFSSKGEAYKPVQITTRAVFEQIYGAPDTEAERYFYAGACEVLNQGGRLFCARLPYDNEAFEKMVGVKYVVEYGSQLTDLSNMVEKTYTSALLEADDKLNEVAIIRGGNSPALYDLSSIDSFRTDEAKVPANTFLIVDTTGATYNRVVEDTRKGQKREVIGIIPVVTTAANGLYMQNYINVGQNLSDYNKFESLCGEALMTLKVFDENGKVKVIDNVSMENDGLLSGDLVNYIGCDAYFHNVEKLSVNVLSTNAEAEQAILNVLSGSLTADFSSLTVDGYDNKFDNERDAIIIMPYVAMRLSSSEADFSVSAISDDTQSSSTYYSIVSAGMFPLEFNTDFESTDGTMTSAQVIAKLEDNNYVIDDLKKQFGWHGLNGDNTPPDTISFQAAQFFPTIQPAADGNGGLDSEHLKDIGVVVFRAYLDPTEGNKVSVEPVEAYAGSLYKDDKDPNTGVTKFIDTIINTQSQYINFFSNCFSTPAAKKYYKDNCDILLAPPATGACLGFYSEMTKKDISISKSILDGMNKSFEKVADINERDIDIVPDAGLANIASYIKAIFGEKGPYDLSITDDLGNSLLGMWKCKRATDSNVRMWKTVLLKHDDFCKNTRKDCMFVADGLSPLVLQGQKKIVRDTKPSNSIDKDILPYIPAMCGINTNYGAGYADWFEQADDYTGDFFWCPPSIKATGCYVNTDINFDYWLAPAGLTRGIVAATDVAFSPNDKQAGAFYEKNWNYAINYPQDGIVLEGQKTFQTKPTALDRVNVRRMMLHLERQVYKVLRYFVYENNTAYVRQRIVDAIEPILKECWQSGSGGLNRYKIVCDDTNNTPNVIDNHELKIAIGVVPNKTAEYLMVDWIVGGSGATWEELF